MLTKEAIQELLEPQSINAAATALQLAVSAFVASGEDTRGLVVLPNHFGVNDLEAHLPERRRARGTMNTSSVQCFAEYINHQAAGAESTVSVFVDAPRMKAVAVLNLGTVDEPGHADNRAIYSPTQTAAYVALRHITSNPMTQKDVAEWMEDWVHLISPRGADDLVIIPKLAIDAVRRITIDESRKVESEAASLQATRSTLEQVVARSAAGNLPAFIDVALKPYLGFDERTFSMRLSIITTGKDPMLRLRVVKAEEHAEQMANELLGQVEQAINGDLVNLYTGTYEPLK